MTTVDIQCRGRGFKGEPVLPTPLPITVNVYKYSDRFISVSPEKCPHNTGSHGQRCMAGHPGKEKVGEGILCPYSFDYPYATEFSGWKMPVELKPIFDKMASNE